MSLDIAKSIYLFMKTTLHTNCQEAIELLKKIKDSKGNRKLNKLGEWLEQNHAPVLTWKSEDLAYILK